LVVGAEAWLKFAILFSLLFISSAFAAGGTSKGLKAKKFKCRYEPTVLIMKGLDAADDYVKSISNNPQLKAITVYPSPTLNRLGEDEYFDFTLIVPIHIQSTEGKAEVISIYPQDEYGHKIAYFDLVIPFSVVDTGPKKKCGVISGVEKAIAEGKSYLLPSYKVITTEGSPTVLDNKPNEDPQ
jgi:hypothetical protein